MLLSTNLVGSPAGSATDTKPRVMCEPAAFAGCAAPGSASHLLCQDPESLNGVYGNSRTGSTESGTSTAGYGAPLMWPPEDDKAIDQDDGWQVVAGKSCTKVAAHHNQQQHHSNSVPLTGGSAKVQVCGRCGMRGHIAAKCRQPHCSKCNRWWHTEDDCSKACSTCGSLDHRVCGASLCKSYKCRECGLYGHVYAECPNIRCNICGEVGHKALGCPTIVCNICKQKGHKAVNCSQPKHGSNISAASKSTAPHLAELQQLATAVPSQQSSYCDSSSSVTSPVAVATPIAAGGTVRGIAGQAAAAVFSYQVCQQEVPLNLHGQRPSNVAEQQLLQQQHSQLLAQLLKSVPDVAVACLEDSKKLQALCMIEPQHINALLQPAADITAEVQRSQLEAALASAQRQLQQKQLQSGSGDLPAVHGHHPATSAVGGPVQRKPALSNSPAPAAGAAGHAVSPAAEDLTDATQGIKPGDLAPQHAKQLVSEFGDMLPSRWQQLPSWRQLEARLSFPDGNYVQRRLQFREKRRQLQLLTLQLRTAGSGKQAGSTMASKVTGVAAITGKASTQTRVVPETPAAPATTLQHQSAGAVSKPAGIAPCSYAAALAGRTAAGSATPSSSSTQHIPGGSASVEATGIGVAVCSRCGMMGHHSTSCVQPRCTRCHLWWHTEAQCSSACQFCGSLDHAGDAEQPASCQSFKCKACRMFGHTQSICPHVQLHQQQLQQQGSSASSLQPPASPLSSKGVGTGASSSNGSEASFYLPDSPGLGQQGVKPKDLLPEHAKALQDEFPNALPPGWQQMGSWRMVEERLRVVAVEGAVFSKRRQMWRDRRKHYQALTAQALAAAARSAAAAAANIAASEESAAARLAAAHNQGQSMNKQQPAGVAQIVSHVMQDEKEQQDVVQQQQSDTQQELAGQDGVNMSQMIGATFDQSQQSVSTPLQSHPQQLPDSESSTLSTCEPEQPTRPHNLKGSQQYSMDPVLIPEWQQRGSLFGLIDTAPGSMPLDSAGTGSAFSCDTNFSSSPPPASDTPSVMLSPLTDGLGYSGGSTPATASANNSNAVTPAASAAGFAGVQACATAGMSSPMPSAPSNTPMPTPRSAAAAAVMPSSAAYPTSTMVPMDASRVSPMHMPQSAAPGVMRSPLGYPAMQVPPSSPIDMHMAAAAMAAGRGAGPQAYQHMVHVAQRQSQLQQQLMLQQGRYNRTLDHPQGHQHMLLQMQLQQQQQHRMQRQCRADQAFLVQQQMRHQQQQQQVQKLHGKPMMAAGFGDEVGETGELDDTLGVLGVLGLQ